MRSEIENTDTQIKFCKIVAIPTGLYGSETWFKSTGDRSRLQATEMLFLTRVAGLTRRCHVRSQAVRNNLEVQSLLDNIDKYSINWLNHVQRLEANRLRKTVMKYKPK
jgi:hypothetical protein